MRTAIALALACGSVWLSAAGAWAADRDGLRGYLALRVGGGPVFTRNDRHGGVDLENPAPEALGAFAVGLNLTEHWGFEIAGEGSETSLQDTGGKKLAEYALFTVLAQARWRYPLLERRLVPYLVLGAGVGSGEVNDKNVDDSTSGSPVAFGTDYSPLGSAGGGLEYFVMSNVAVGAELKYLYGFTTAVEVGGRDRDFDLDALVYSFGLRIFYPQE